MIEYCTKLKGFYEPLGFHALTGMAKRNYENQTGAVSRLAART